MAVRGTRKKTPNKKPANGGKARSPGAAPDFESLPAEERLLSDALLDSLPGVFYMYGRDLKLKRWNRNFEQVTGYGAAELARMSPLDLFSGADRSLVKERIHEVFEIGHSDAEADFVCKDGSRKPYYFTGLRTRMAGEDYLLGVGIDLAVLRHTQQKLVATEERLREILEAANVGIAVAAADDRFMEVNPGFCAMLGYTREELLNLHTYDLVHPDDMPESQRITVEVHEGRLDAHRAERRYLRKDGSIVWVNLFAQSVYDDAGRERYSIGIIIDVTEWRRAEVALRESERRLQLANRATFNAIWDWDLRSNALWWNETFLSLFGYDAGEIEPGIESWTNRIHPEDLERVVHGIHAAIDSGVETWRAEYRFRRGDGQYVDVEDRGYIAHDALGHPSRMIGAMQDITDRKRGEDKLRKSEEHLRLALDAAQMATFDWDMNTGKVRWTHTGGNWFGRAPGTFQGPIDEFARFVHDDDRAGMWQAIESCIATRSPYSHEYRLVWPDRSVHWIQAEASLDFGPDGKPLRMRGVALETTARRQAEEALKLFRTLVDRAKDPIEVIDPVTGRFLDVNDTFCQALGFSREEVLSMSVPDIDPTFAPALWPAKARALRAAGSQVAEGWHRRKDGSTFPVEVSMAWVHLDRDYIVASLRDISERRQAEQSIRRLNRIHAVLSGINSLIVRERDRDQLFAAACRIIVEKGRFTCAWIGTLTPDGNRITLVARHGQGADLPAKAITISADAGSLSGRDILAASLATGKPAFADILSGDAAPHLALIGLQYSGFRSGISLPLFTHGKGVGVLVLYAAEAGVFDTDELALLTELAGDISFSLEYMESQVRIRHMAFHEPLTGLTNRAHLLTRLEGTVEQARADGHSCALLLINLNNFRSVNNSLGHLNGDRLLQQVAERLRRTVWETDIVASLGGDEFAILLPRLANSDDVDLVVQKLTSGMSEIFTVADLPLGIEPRIGYAMYPEQADSAGLLWQRASVALRAAKERHRTAMQYDNRFDHYDPAKLALLSGLRAAIDENQLQLHYQPKIDLRTMTVVGAEALVRWLHPQRGMIYPDTFIPLAEQTTLIAPLTKRVLAMAMVQGREWMKQGLDLHVAVNLSARNIHDANLCTDILELARNSGFPVQRMILEITESAIMDDPDQGRTVLARLSEAGICISMDDFGIGQSSLAYLKELPVTQVKIDKSFVMGMHESRNATIVHAAIDLAHSLGMKVTAEGVEDEATLAQLQDWKCDTAQGYFFSKPLPPDRFMEWLRGTKWQ